MTDALEPPPKPTRRDKTTAVLLAGISEAPFVGTVVELLAQVFGTAYEDRQHASAEMVHAALVDLDARSIDVETLADRPAFVSAVHAACRIALGQHLEEKLDMLKAVLISSACSPPGRTTDLTTMRFLRLVDELEPEHIVALRRCQVRGKINQTLYAFGREIVGTLEEIGSAYRSIGLERDELGLIFNDLISHGLIVDRKPDRHSASEEVKAARTTSKIRAAVPPDDYDTSPMGTEFLRWLTVV